MHAYIQACMHTYMCVCVYASQKCIAYQRRLNLVEGVSLQQCNKPRFKFWSKEVSTFNIEQWLK